MRLRRSAGTPRSPSVFSTGDPSFCQFVFRDPATGFIKQVDAQQFNISSLKNRGVDVGVTYRRALHLLPDDRLTFDLKWTHLIKNQSKASSLSPTNRLCRYVRPRLLARLGVPSDFVQVRHRHVGLADRLSERRSVPAGFGVFGDPRVNELNRSRITGLMTRRSGSTRTSVMTLYFNVDNVFNKKPDLLPGASFGTPTGLETTADEDVFGRRFLAGVRVKFF